ncbi:unnamed protein product [Rhodiola kirilowii]
MREELDWSGALVEESSCIVRDVVEWMQRTCQPADDTLMKQLHYLRQVLCELLC